MNHPSSSSSATAPSSSSSTNCHSATVVRYNFQGDIEGTLHAVRSDGRRGRQSLGGGSATGENGASGMATPRGRRKSTSSAPSTKKSSASTGKRGLAAPGSGDAATAAAAAGSVDGLDNGRVASTGKSAVKRPRLAAKPPSAALGGASVEKGGGASGSNSGYVTAAEKRRAAAAAAGATAAAGNAGRGGVASSASSSVPASAKKRPRVAAGSGSRRGRGSSSGGSGGAIPASGLGHDFDDEAGANVDDISSSGGGAGGRGSGRKPSFGGTQPSSAQSAFTAFPMRSTGGMQHNADASAYDEPYDDDTEHDRGIGSPSRRSRSRSRSSSSAHCPDSGGSDGPRRRTSARIHASPHTQAVSSALRGLSAAAGTLEGVHSMRDVMDSLAEASNHAAAAAADSPAGRRASSSAAAAGALSSADRAAASLLSSAARSGGLGRAPRAAVKIVRSPEGPHGSSGSSGLSFTRDLEAEEGGGHDPLPSSRRIRYEPGSASGSNHTSSSSSSSNRRVRSDSESASESLLMAGVLLGLRSPSVCSDGPTSPHDTATGANNSKGDAASSGPAASTSSSSSAAGGAETLPRARPEGAGMPPRASPVTFVANVASVAEEEEPLTSESGGDASATPQAAHASPDLREDGAFGR